MTDRVMIDGEGNDGRVIWLTCEGVDSSDSDLDLIDGNFKRPTFFIFMSAAGDQFSENIEKRLSRQPLILIIHESTRIVPGLGIPPVTEKLCVLDGLKTKPC